MLSLRSKPELKDLSQGSRIAYVRYYRGMTQHQVADMLGVQHDNKRRIMTRYEKGDRNPKEKWHLDIIGDGSDLEWIFQIIINLIMHY